VFTTTNQTPDEVYKTGLSEVDRITKAIEILINEAGFKGNIAQLFDYMKTNPKFYPFKKQTMRCWIVLKGYCRRCSPI
jgi:uncharacterized protein (DUF885 family)